MTDDFAAQVVGISALAEPARRELYGYVVAQPEPVGRDQVAAGTGLPRHAVKFHLDKLVDEGLLETEFRRLSGKQGPGAGRPAKLYRRAIREVSISLPERRYVLAGEILAAAVAEAATSGQSVLAAVTRSAAAAGHRIGVAAREVSPPGPDVPTLVALAGILADQGYEPRIEADVMVLRNCPFHALAQQHTELVCGMNREVITALTDELGYRDVSVQLDPGPDRCCVTLRTRRCGE